MNDRSNILLVQIRPNRERDSFGSFAAAVKRHLETAGVAVESVESNGGQQADLLVAITVQARCHQSDRVVLLGNSRSVNLPALLGKLKAELKVPVTKLPLGPGDSAAETARKILAQLTAPVS